VIARNYPGSLSHILEVFKDNRVSLTKVVTNLLNSKNELNIFKRKNYVAYNFSFTG
jgi:prephenate dehydratase